MKKLIFLLLLALFSNSLFAQNIITPVSTGYYDTICGSTTTPVIIGIDSSQASYSTIKKISWSTGDSSNTITFVPPLVDVTPITNVITLTITNIADSVDTFEYIFITVPSPKHFLSNLTFCQETNISNFLLSDTINKNCAYLWNITGSNKDSSSITVYPASGTYKVIVTNQYGCSIYDSSILTALVTPHNVISLLTQAGCVDSVGYYLPLINVDSFYWATLAPNGILTPIPVFSDTIYTKQMNTYYAIMINNDGCTDTTSQPFSIYPFPKPYIDNLNVCAAPVTLIDSINTKCTYLWNDGGTTDVHILPTPANQNVTTTNWVKITNQFFCHITDTFTCSYKPVPPADIVQFTQTGCVDSAGYYTPPGVGVDSFYWVTQAPNGVLMPMPVYNSDTLYVKQSGVYGIVTLNNDGCTDTASQSIDVYQFSKPYLHDTTLCQTINQADFSINDTINNSCTYLWNNGNTQPTYTINPNIAAQLTNWVTIKTVNGCTINDTVNTYVKALPKPLLPDSSFLCSGKIATTLKDTSNANYSYVWSFNNTIMSTSDSVVANQAGNYNVDVTNNLGCSVSDTINVESVVGFYNDFKWVRSSTDCTIPTLEFDPFYQEQNIQSYLWDFGDGTTSIEASPIHIYTSFDSFTVTFSCIYYGVKYNDCNKSIITHRVSPTCNLTGINNVNNINGLTLYPNPTNSVVNIKLDEGNINGVVLMDMVGNILDNDVNVNSKETMIDMSSFAQGIYLVKVNIETANGIISTTRKINKL